MIRTFAQHLATTRRNVYGTASEADRSKLHRSGPFYANGARGAPQTSTLTQDIQALLKLTPLDTSSQFEVSKGVQQAALKVLSHIFSPDALQPFEQTNPAAKDKFVLALIRTLTAQPHDKPFSVPEIRGGFLRKLYNVPDQPTTRTVPLSAAASYHYFERMIASVIDPATSKSERAEYQRVLRGLVEQLPIARPGFPGPFDNNTIAMAWIVGNLGRKNQRLPHGLSSDRYFAVLRQYPPIPEDLK